jgi:peroxiredoxin (alkyl hydroperoxide reductase subunit C)
MLPVGSTAPDFTLPNQDRTPVTLSAFRGHAHVVLAFHPLAFTPVCSTQVQTYERERPRFDALDARVLVISNDPGPSKKAWGDALGGVACDLLSDFHPHGAVAGRYGVLRDDGLAERAIVLVDRGGTIRWTRLYDIPEQPDVEQLLSAIGRLARDSGRAG